MNCLIVYRHICDNLDQKLDSPRCRQIKKHLAICPDCAAYLDSLKKMIRLYRAVPSPHLTEAAHSRLVRAVRVLDRQQPAGNRKTR